MTRINPVDLSFLLLEKANRPLHMAAFLIFQKPKGQQSSFGPRLFDAYRHSQAVKPSSKCWARIARHGKRSSQT
jgi:diacylglycerol O-acyltransferase / wax synthase